MSQNRIFYFIVTQSNLTVAEINPHWSCVLFGLQSMVLIVLSVKCFLGVVICFGPFHSLSLAHPGFAVQRPLVVTQNKVCRCKCHQRPQALRLRSAVRTAFFVETFLLFNK
ncbi:hypothetical protein ATANTOWER_023569 [Ataeniobius toweri]|uniref:Uncharacterized protein n=1 Tax=Ataeniobius toweri TaxID=208326 RepID=A0ABU7A281_9TELE|nr:hypothetical protein [Ataeniobius toweri]